MNLSAESQNWSKEIRLDSRITKLENSMAPKQYHAFRYIVGEQTEQEAMEECCKAKGLDPIRFENGEYGKVIVLARKIVRPGDIERVD
jgi:hypothetical protein